MVADISVTSGKEWVAIAGQANLPPGSTKQEMILDADSNSIPDLAFLQTPPDFEIDITGRKINDENGNGIEDPGELGRAGVEIRLYEDVNENQRLDASDRFLLTDITDAGGVFFFRVIQDFNGLPDSFIVVEVLQPGLVQTQFTGPALIEGDIDIPVPPTSNIVTPGFDSGGATLGQRGYAFTNLQGDTNVIDVDFLNIQRGSIHGIKVVDLNGNGEEDPGEPRLDGVTFTLTGTDYTGAAITPVSVVTGDNPSTPTVEEGEFWFEDLLPGTYTVTETVPAGFAPTTPSVVADISVTSGKEWVAIAGQANLPPGSTKQEMILDADSNSIPDLAFLQTPPDFEIDITGRKINDENGNGIEDPGELGRAGVEIRLYEDVNENQRLDASDRFLLTDITDAGGVFFFRVIQDFNGLPDSFIVVEVLQPGLVQTQFTGPALIEGDIDIPVPPTSNIVTPGFDSGGATLGQRGYAFTNLQGDTNVIDVDFLNTASIPPTKFSFLVTSLQSVAVTSTTAVSQQQVVVVPAASSIVAPPLPVVANTVPSQVVSASTSNSITSETPPIFAFRSLIQADAPGEVAANQTEIGPSTIVSAVHQLTVQSTPAVFVANLEATMVETEPAVVSSTPNSATSEPVVSAESQPAQKSPASGTAASAHQIRMASIASASAIPTSSRDPLSATVIDSSATNAAVAATAVGNATPATAAVVTESFVSNSTTSVILPPATSPATAIDTSAKSEAAPATAVGNVTPATVGAVAARFASSSMPSVIPPPIVSESLSEPVSTASITESEPVVVNDRLESESPVIEGSVSGPEPNPSAI